MEDGPVAVHLEPVFLGQVADAAGLEVNQGDAVRAEDEPVHDAEAAGVGEVLLVKHLAGPEEDLGYLRRGEEALDGGAFVSAEVIEGWCLAAVRELGEGRVDAQAPLDPGLDVRRAQGGVRVVAVGRSCRGFGKGGRGEWFVVQGPLRHRAVVVLPAEWGPLGSGDRGLGRAKQALAEALEVALFVGPKQDGQALACAGGGHVEEVCRLLGPSPFPGIRIRGQGLHPGERVGGEEGKLVLGEGKRAAVLGIGDLGRPVQLLLPEEKDMGELQPLGGVDRGELHPVGVLALGHGDQVRQGQEVGEEGRHIPGVGPLEVALRLVPEGFDKDRGEMR